MDDTEKPFRFQAPDLPARSAPQDDRDKVVSAMMELCDAARRYPEVFGAADPSDPDDVVAGVLRAFGVAPEPSAPTASQWRILDGPELQYVPQGSTVYPRFVELERRGFFRRANGPMEGLVRFIRTTKPAPWRPTRFQRKLLEMPSGRTFSVRDTGELPSAVVVEANDLVHRGYFTMDLGCDRPVPPYVRTSKPAPEDPR